jgi:hypothetical protein
MTIQARSPSATVTDPRMALTITMVTSCCFDKHP